MPPIPSHATHTNPCNPYRPMQPIPPHATHTTPCNPYHPIPPYFLFHLPMSMAAQAESSCTLDVISASGGTAGRRNILSNSRTKGAPVTVKGPPVTAGKGALATVFETMVISCTFAGSCRMRLLGLLLRLFGAVLGGSSLPLGACSHFSISSLDFSCCIGMIITIFTSPPDSVSHQLASNLRRRSDSDTPDSMTIVGQSGSFGRKDRGL